MLARRALVGLLLVVTLAGCSGLSSPGDPTPTLSPAAVPTDVPTDRPPRRLAPGVTESGIVDASALAAAHAEVLTGARVTLRYNYTERALDGALRWRTVTTVRFGDDGRYRYARTDSDANGTARRVERWSDGERVVERQRVGDNTTVEILRDARGDPLAPDAALPVDRDDGRGIEAVFDAVPTTVTGRERRNGTTYYRLSGTGPATPNPTAIEDASLRAVVDGRGLVHRYRLGYTIDRGDGPPGRVVGILRVTDLGETTVRRPGWAEKVN
jgi:hypothetical protein